MSKKQITEKVKVLPNFTVMEMNTVNGLGYLYWVVIDHLLI